jgi:DNA-damage-inducible protein D
LARELKELLEYAEWRNFLNFVNKAKESCKTNGEDVSGHFVDINKMVKIGSGTEHTLDKKIVRKNLKKYSIICSN